MRHPHRWLAAAYRFYVQRSGELDRQTLRLPRLPFTWRVRFLCSKARAIPVLLFTSRSTHVRIGTLSVEVSSLTDLGTMQASLADVHDVLVVTGKLATTAPVVVDVGANIGQFSTAIRTFWPTASIVAFEPDPAVHAVLARNARRIGSMVTHAIALGASEDTLPLHRHHISAMSTLRPGRVEHYDPGDTVDVPVARLDDVLPAIGRVDLLKIDVEGYEVEVLRGARQTLLRSRMLLVEVSLGRSIRGTEEEVLDLVRSVRPTARVVSKGRPIGGVGNPICQDLLIDLDPNGRVRQ